MSAYRVTLYFQQPADLGAKLVAAKLRGELDQMTGVEADKLEVQDEYGDWHELDDDVKVL